MSQLVLHAHVNGVFNPVVALFFQLVGKLGAARLHDPSVKQYVNVVGCDVVKDPLVMGHQDNGVLGRAQQIYSVSNDAEGIDIQTGVGLVQQGQFGFQDGHLQNLVPICWLSAVRYRPFNEQ